LLLANDTDPDSGHGPTLSIHALDTTGTVGAVTLVGGLVNYNPNGLFNHLPSGATTNDTFRYIVSDIQGGQATGAVTVTIVGVNTAPTAANNLASQTVQYSDPISSVTLTASDSDS